MWNLSARNNIIYKPHGLSRNHALVCQSTLRMIHGMQPKKEIKMKEHGSRSTLLIYIVIDIETHIVATKRGFCL